MLAKSQIFNNTILSNMNLANQKLTSFPSSFSYSLNKKRRIIRKPQKNHLFQKSLRRGYSYSRVKKGNRFQFESKSIQCHFNKDCSLLQNIYVDWAEPNPAFSRQYIQSFIQQFPTLPSIEELFSLNSEISLEPNIDFEQLLRYAKTCSLLDQSQFHPMLLTRESQAAITIVKKQQASQSPSLIGMLLSRYEASLCEKKSFFMEKLRENESKYDHSIGRMSQISKQLAFVYRIYLETRNQICTTLNNFLSRSPRTQDQLQQTRNSYARLLINKNLRHAFGDTQFDPLNYFKLRQYIEADKVQEFQNFSSLNQFEHFMKRRKPKKGRKHTLATACSVCLSDYYELNNPLKNCQGCGLRAHQLCYSFERKKCGYCTYRKLQKQTKQAVEWCVICRKPGLMAIKIDELHYAHGFCLLMHGFWGIKAKSNSRNIQLSNADLAGSYLNSHSSELESLNQMEIEFGNPIIQKKMPFQQNNVAQQQHQCPIEQQIFDILQPFSPTVGHSRKLEAQKWQKKLEKETCSLCGLSFIHNLSLSCACCGKKYHSLCAFFAGFKITIQEGQLRGGSQKIPHIDCCSSGYSKIGWNRRVKLNYQKCAFSIKAEELIRKQQSQIQHDSRHSLLK